MNRRDIVVGLFILTLLVGAIYLSQRDKEEELEIPQSVSVEDRIEGVFDVEIPEDVEKAELTDVEGGSAMAIATRKFEDQTFEYNILADLPDLPDDQFYQGWLAKGKKGDEGYLLISTGKLSLSKGGWMLNFSSATNYSDYNDALVTREHEFDNNPETHVLEGFF